MRRDSDDSTSTEGGGSTGDSTRELKVCELFLDNVWFFFFNISNRWTLWAFSFNITDSKILGMTISERVERVGRKIQESNDEQCTTR